MLVVMTGLPCTGKSVIAVAVARSLRAALLSADPIDEALLRSGLDAHQRPDIVGYGIMRTLAEEQLVNGLSAVIDAVNPFETVRQAYSDIATKHGSTTLFISTYCSDQQVHRQRVEHRRAKGHKAIDWAGVERQISYYEPHLGECLALDAVEPVATNVSTAVAYVARSERTKTT